MGGTEEIKVVSGVSWLHDKMLADATERSDFLKESIAGGVTDGEYRQMVGKYKEIQRFIKITLPETFEEFYQSSDEGESDDLEELSDE